MARERKTTSGLSSDYIFHPGLTLEEVLSDRKISQKDLALSTGVSSKHISEVISGKKDISVSFAKKLEYALGIEAQFWINLQSNYDREMYEYTEVNSISKDEIEILHEFEKSNVIKDYLDLNLIDRTEASPVAVIKLRSLLEISDLCNIPLQSYAAAYRIRTNVNSYVLYAWQKMCEQKNKGIKLDKQLDIDKLKNSLNKIKQAMFLQPDQMQEKLKSYFAECGIIFDIVHNYKGAPVYGYIKELQNNNLLLCMTIRGKFMDIFWFTLFHEIAHIINGDTKNYFIDFSNEDNSKEDRANSFARNCLINHDDYLQFLETDYKNIDEINKFANKCKVDPSVVIGRLQNDGELDHSTFTKYRKRYEWV